MHHHIQALYTQARDLPADDPLWEAIWQAERAMLPTCINHPDRVTVGGFDETYYCAECIGAEIQRRRLWMKSFSVVRGGVEALRYG